MNEAMANSDQENSKYFDKWSKNYDDGRITEWFKYTQELTIGVIPLEKDSKILDVGCGTGAAVLMLAELLTHGNACGIDISEGMIETASQKVPSDLSGRMEFQHGSSDNIPYPDGYFDHVMCTNSFHHYPDPVKALREMQRVMQPGGHIVIFENAPDLSVYTWLWDRYFRVFEKGHVKYYPSKELGELLRKADLDNVTLHHLRNECLKYGKLFASIQVWSGQKPVSEHNSKGRVIK